MSKERIPVLPSVLAKYDPNVNKFVDEPKQKGKGQKCEHTSSNPAKTTKKVGNEKKTDCQHSNKSKAVVKEQGHSNQQNTRPKAVTLLGEWKDPRRRSAKKRSEEEAERLEHVYQLWEQVQHEYRQERLEQLEEKVRLQHRLIRAQDKLAQCRVVREQRVQAKKRSEERRAKQEKSVTLQNQGRKSGAGKPAKEKDEDTSPTTDSNEESETSPGSPTTTDSSGQRREKTRHSHHTGYLPSDAYAPANSPMKELLYEEDEEEEEMGLKPRVPDGVVTPADLTTVPWHHAQLYKMYGRNADYYIHPKMQEEKKKIVNSTLKSQKGHLGAKQIWTTLRNASMNKLLKTDRRFPKELKEAFSSHVREGITNHKKPVYRHFTEKDDVPDLNRLMDQSLLRHIRVLRHKTELMYRSSKTNNDRTKVMLFNSPLPSVNEGDEGIDKYLPSWEDVTEAESELSYTKWLKKKGASETLESTDSTTAVDVSCQEEGPRREMCERRRHPESVLSPLGSEFSDSLHSVWDSIMARQRPQPQPRIHFLTEAETRSHGAFLEKLGLNRDKLDLGRIDLLPAYQQQLHAGGLTGRSSSQTFKAVSPPESRASRHSISGPLPPVDQSTMYKSRWQPLSLNALVEYKDQLGTQGQGDFHQGRPAMWKAGGITSASMD